MKALTNLGFSFNYIVISVTCKYDRDRRVTLDLVFDLLKIAAEEEQLNFTGYIFKLLVLTLNNEPKSICNQSSSDSLSQPYGYDVTFILSRPNCGIFVFLRSDNDSFGIKPLSIPIGEIQLS